MSAEVEEGEAQGAQPTRTRPRTRTEPLRQVGEVEDPARIVEVALAAGLAPARAAAAVPLAVVVPTAEAAAAAEAAVAVAAAHAAAVARRAAHGPAAHAAVELLAAHVARGARRPPAPAESVGILERGHDGGAVRLSVVEHVHRHLGVPHALEHGRPGARSPLHVRPDHPRVRLAQVLELLPRVRGR